MPAWSTEIADVFITLARARQRPLDHLQLQRLIYLAHGWCLATRDQPLTGDRPERGADPWRAVYADGAGKLRDISHRQVRAQFVGLADDLNRQGHSRISPA